MKFLYLKGLSLRRRLQLQSKTDPKTGCKIWIGNGRGSRIATRYPTIHVNGKKIIASRAIWEIYRGKIPIGLNVLHKCDNKRCIKLNHLYLGTDKDNMRDFLERDPRAKEIFKRFQTMGVAAAKRKYYSMTPEERKVNGFGMWGKKHSEKTRQKMKAARLAYYAARKS